MRDHETVKNWDDWDALGRIRRILIRKVFRNIIYTIENTADASQCVPIVPENHENVRLRARRMWAIWVVRLYGGWPADL